MTRAQYRALQPGDVIRWRRKLRVVVCGGHSYCSLRRVGYTWTGRGVVTYDRGPIVKEAVVTGAVAKLTREELAAARSKKGVWCAGMPWRWTRKTRRAPRRSSKPLVVTPAHWTW